MSGFVEVMEVMLAMEVRLLKMMVEVEVDTPVAVVEVRAGEHPGNDGGNGGSVLGNVGSGGDAKSIVNGYAAELKDSTINVTGGDGGDGGQAGENSVTRNGGAGGGGSGYSSGGGGGGGNDAQPNGTGGSGGPVMGSVADGGYAEVSIVSTIPTVHRDCEIFASGGQKGCNTEASAPLSVGGKGSGRETSDGQGSTIIPMSYPKLTDPLDGFHVGSEPILKWTHVEDSSVNGTLDGYSIQIDTGPGFQSPEISQDLTMSMYTPTTLSKGIHYWRVKARYSTPPATTPGWSEVWTFIHGPNDAPIITDMPNEMTIDEDSVNNKLGNVHEMFSDLNGDRLGYWVSGQANIVVELSPDGDIFLTPHADWVGVETILVHAKELMADPPLEVSRSVLVTVANVNDPPSITTIGFATVAMEDEEYRVDFDATDVDVEDGLTWSIGTSSGFLYIDSMTGLLTGMPNNSYVGAVLVKIIATDDQGETDVIEYRLSVVNVNDPPRIVSEDVEVCEPSDVYLVEYEAEDIDPDEDTLSWTLVTNATFLDIEASTGLLSDGDKIKPKGSYWVNISVFDGEGGRDSHNYTLKVMSIDDPPEVDEIPLMNIQEDEPTVIDLSLIINDEDNGPEDLVLECDHDQVTDIEGLKITVLYETWMEDHSIGFTISDGLNSVSGSVPVRIVEVNDPPDILRLGVLMPPFVMVVDEGSKMWFPILVEDEESEAFLYRTESSWGGIKVFANGTVLIYTQKGELGSFDANLTVEDPSGGIGSVSLSIEVVNVNDPPAQPLIVEPLMNTTIRRGDTIIFSVKVSDPDLPFGDVLVVTWKSDLMGELKSLESLGGELNFSTNKVTVGQHIITVTVSDGSLTATSQIELTVDKRLDSQGDQPFYTTNAGIIIISLILSIIVVGLIFYMMTRPYPRIPVS